MLIVGAGIGGLGLAALLHQQGVKVSLVERAQDFSHAGYMLGLYPLGNRILHGIGVFREFERISQPLEMYQICNSHAQIIHEYPLGKEMRRFGTIAQLKRSDLLEILRGAAPDVPLEMGAVVASVEQTPKQATVVLSDGTRRSADLVVGADGIHSRVRRFVAGEVPDAETGFGCWVCWADHLDLPHDTITEYWGTGRFLGVYPTRGNIGLIVAGPKPLVGPDAIGSDGRRLREALEEFKGPARELVDSIPDSLEGLFWWNLTDVRCEKWVEGRVALVGDSACAFLPTAGVGASMALESAAVLADELRRTDAAFLPAALELYQKRRQKRAEAAQSDSRGLAKLMFTENRALAWTRDELLKFYSLEALVRNILKSLAEPL